MAGGFIEVYWRDKLGYGGGVHGSKSIVLVVEVPVYTHDRIEACMAAEQGSYHCVGGCGAGQPKASLCLCAGDAAASSL